MSETCQQCKLPVKVTKGRAITHKRANGWHGPVATHFRACEGSGKPTTERRAKGVAARSRRSSRRPRLRQLTQRKDE